MMNWIEEYQLFLFDFDGLLVNTEDLHYRAYKEMCANRGFNLDWSFERYCQAAHYGARDVEKQIYERFPALKEKEPHWPTLYAEKKQAYLNLLRKGQVELMPGAEKMLTLLEKAEVNRCVVTNSAEELVSTIRKQNPILDSIPHWITREHYKEAKPSSECYEYAIEHLASKGAAVIGFEDSPRGITALQGTRAKAVLVTKIAYHDHDTFLEPDTLRYESMEDLLELDILPV